MAGKIVGQLVKRYGDKLKSGGMAVATGVNEVFNPFSASNKREADIKANVIKTSVKNLKEKKPLNTGISKADQNTFYSQMPTLGGMAGKIGPVARSAVGKAAAAGAGNMLRNEAKAFVGNVAKKLPRKVGKEVASAYSPYKQQ